jgi:hypothetical protein
MLVAVAVRMEDPAVSVATPGARISVRAAKVARHFQRRLTASRSVEEAEQDRATILTMTIRQAAERQVAESFLFALTA